jgi:hypothetical protein
MAEVQSYLPQVFPGKRLQVASHRFMFWKLHVLQVKVSHKHPSVHLFKFVANTFIIKYERASCVCGTRQVVSTRID